MLVDSHTHLIFPEFQEDLEETVRRAEEADVRRMIVPGIDLPTSRRAVELAERFDPVYAAIGVHPQDSAAFQESEMTWFRETARHPKVVAIGEIGLDYYRDYAPRERQLEVLRKFLSLAAEERLPVILHNRKAFADLWAEVQAFAPGDLAGVFHCFSEGVAEAERVIGRGFLVSFTGTITFKKSSSAEIARQIPLEKQMLETDAPFMAPVPHRGKRNEPAFVRYIAEKQGELHGLPLEKVAEITTRNAFALFSKLTG